MGNCCSSVFLSKLNFNPTKMRRRKFIKTSAVGAAAISVPLILNANIKGANYRVRVGVIGIHGMGQNHI